MRIYLSTALAVTAATAAVASTSAATPAAAGGAGAVGRKDDEVLRILSCRTECNLVCHTGSIRCLRPDFRDCFACQPASPSMT